MNDGDVQVFEKSIDGKPIHATWLFCGGEPPLYVWTRIVAHPALRGKGNYPRYLEALNDDIFDMLGEAGCGGGLFDFIGAGGHDAREQRTHALEQHVDRPVLCRSVTTAGAPGVIGPAVFMYCWPPLHSGWTAIPDTLIDRMLAAHDMRRHAS